MTLATVQTIKEIKMNKSKALTWNDLANLYDKEHSGRKARTLDMNTVFQWAERQTNKFYVDPNTDTIHLIKTGENKWRY